MELCCNGFQMRRFCELLVIAVVISLLMVVVIAFLMSSTNEVNELFENEELTQIEQTPRKISLRCYFSPESCV